MWYVSRDTVNSLQHTITHYTPSGKKNLMAGYNEAPAFKSIHLEVVATWIQVTVFFPIGVQLTSKKKKKNHLLDQRPLKQSLKGDCK